MNVITFGTYDLLHVGHVRLLQRASELTKGGKLYVGVSSDALNKLKKGKNPIYSETDRMEIIKALRYVDHVFLEESLEDKGEYIKRCNADLLVMGDDWKGKFDHFGIPVVYLPRTPFISTSSTCCRVKCMEPL